MEYEAFISYSHKNDQQLAKSLQRVVQTLGKPWYRVRSVRIFRDETSLTATPKLWPTIVEALSNSKFLLLIASSDAASSAWVSKEVEWWLANKTAETLLIILSEGTLHWNNASGDFDKHTSQALPSALFGQFHSEPLWIDLSEWRDIRRDVSNDVQFKALASKIAARLKNIPPEDLWSEELTQQRRNLRMAGYSIATLLILLSASLWLTYFSMQQKATAQIANMDATARIGNYTQTLASATPLKSTYLLSEAQLHKGESLLYEALWHNRIVKRIQLDDKHTIQFKDDTEQPVVMQLEKNSRHPLTRLFERFDKREYDPVDEAQDDTSKVNQDPIAEGSQEETADDAQEEATEYTPPRHWQTPDGFATWSADRRQIRIDIPRIDNRYTHASMTVTLEKCLANGDNEYRVEIEAEEELPRLISARKLLGNSVRAVEARKNLVAPIYHVNRGSDLDYILVEVASTATLEDSWNQEILCIISIEPQTASILEIYNPDLTLGLSMRIDNPFGLYRFSPGAMSYLEMKNGNSLTLSQPPHLKDKITLLEDLSALPYNNDIDQRVAFSKDGEYYIVSGYSRDGVWTQPYVSSVREGGKTILSGHDEEVITVMISDSGDTAVTIDHGLIARIWNLTDRPMETWLNQNTNVIRPHWIESFIVEISDAEEIAKSKHEGLIRQLLGMKSLNNIHAATIPACGRTIVKFGGNDSSDVIGERDSSTFIGLVDLRTSSLIYSLPEAEFAGDLFYFCSPEEGAAFALEFADKTGGLEGIQ